MSSHAQRSKRIEMATEAINASFELEALSDLKLEKLPREDVRWQSFKRSELVRFFATPENLKMLVRIRSTSPSVAKPVGCKVRAAFETAEKAGQWAKPEFGSVFYNLNGPDQAQARMHVTVSVPGATTQTLGLPENGSKGGAWIMNAGTSAAHIMTPGQ